MESNNETLHKKIRQNNETIKPNNETMKHQLETYREEITHRITETNEKIEKTNETLVQFREEIINQIINVEDNSKIRVEILQQETQEKFEKLQDKLVEQNDQLENNLGQVQCRVNHNKENQWDIVKYLLDESFKNIIDIWWTAISNVVNSLSLIHI